MNLNDRFAIAAAVAAGAVFVTTALAQNGGEIGGASPHIAIANAFLQGEAR